MPIKRLLLALALIASSTLTQASQTMYGVSLISQKITQDLKLTGGSSTESSETGSGIGLYADLFYKRHYRFNGSVSYSSFDNSKILSLMASADYLFPINYNISLFSGFTIGGALLTFNDSGLSDGSIGSIYGLQLGVISTLPYGLMLELGYKIRPANFETEITDPTTGAAVATSTVTELNETYLNMTYRF